jgi:hypothetical protein
MPEVSLAPSLNMILQQLTQLAEATKSQVIATQVAAIVTAAGKPVSIQQVRDLYYDLYWATYPQPNSGAYMEWSKSKDFRLSKVFGAD